MLLNFHPTAIQPEQTMHIPKYSRHYSWRSIEGRQMSNGFFIEVLQQFHVSMKPALFTSSPAHDINPSTK
jgi:hypothetical protein